MAKSKSNKVIQDWYAQRLAEHYSQGYLAMLEGEDGPQEALGDQAVRIPREQLVPLPEAVRAAHAYYHQHFEQTDLGSSRVYRVPAGNKTTYAVRVTTDGDDSFLEVYDDKGGFLAAGRGYLELIRWGTQEWLRAQAPTPWDLPPELQAITWSTLWGKPVEGYHCMETCKHECRTKPPGRCAGAIDHVADGSAHRCATCGHSWGGVPRPAEREPVLIPGPADENVWGWRVEAYFTDEGIYQKCLVVTEVPIVTEKGRQVVPTSRITHVEFAARAPGASDVIHLDSGETLTGRIDGEAFPMRDQWDKLVRLDRLRRVHSMPPEMDDYANQFGTQHRFTIWGRTDGTLFGTKKYTLHSCLATAAVHAGKLKEGELGVVQVEIIETPKTFRGSEKHGVESDEWDADYEGGAFQFVGPKKR